MHTYTYNFSPQIQTNLEKDLGDLQKARVPAKAGRFPSLNEAAITRGERRSATKRKKKARQHWIAFVVALTGGALNFPTRPVCATAECRQITTHSCYFCSAPVLYRPFHSQAVVIVPLPRGSLVADCSFDSHSDDDDDDDDKYHTNSKTQQNSKHDHNNHNSNNDEKMMMLVVVVVVMEVVVMAITMTQLQLLKTYKQPWQQCNAKITYIKVQRCSMTTS